MVSEDKRKYMARWRASHYEQVREGNLKRSKRYRELHVREVGLRVTKWHKEHPEERRIHQAKYRAANKGKLKIALQDWRKKNPEKDRASDLRRRALKNNAKGFCSSEQLRSRVEFYGGRCWICNGQYDSIDHVIPLSKGGSNWPSNLRPACRSCNSVKGSRLLITNRCPEI